MAEILSREYPTGSVDAFKADMETMMDWDKVEGSGSIYTFKLHNDADGNSFAGISIYGHSGDYPTADPICSNGTNVYSAAMIPTNGHFRFVNFVRWDDGFCAHATKDSSMPCTGGGYTSFGACKGTDAHTGEVKWVSWEHSSVTGGNTFIGSEKTASTGKHSHYYTANGKITVAEKLYAYATPYTPNGILRLAMFQDGHISTCGYCTWNGKRYYRNGAIFIPIE